MKNDNRNFFSPDLELFNGGSWGAYGGGRSPYIGLWSSWIYLNFGKKTHFQGYMRGVHGGRMEGCWNGGADGGATFGIHGGGAGGAFQLLLKHFLTQKLRFFEMDAILIIKYWRPPPSCAPHNVTCEIWKYGRWPWTTIKNHVFTIISHVYKLSWASIWDF